MKKFAFAVMVSVAFAGCGGEKAAPGPEAAQAAPPVPATDVGYTDIGIPECDRYARKYLACLERVPEGSRAMARKSFEQTREHWSLVAEKPERRASLAGACAQQEKASQAAMSRYGCDW